MRKKNEFEVKLIRMRDLEIFNKKNRVRWEQIWHKTGPGRSRNSLHMEVTEHTTSLNEFAWLHKNLWRSHHELWREVIFDATTDAT